MKVVLSSNKPSKAPVVPPIPLIKGEEKAYAKGSYTTLKLHSNPAEENSPIYEIQVPYFKSGTCEQVLEFMDKVQAIIVGTFADYTYVNTKGPSVDNNFAYRTVQ